MLRAAAELTRDLNTPRPAIYWADLLASVAIGYLALAGAITLAGGWAVAAGVVAVLALYRALSFIHEQIGRAHVCTPVINAQLVCRLLLGKKNPLRIRPRVYPIHSLHTKKLSVAV